MTKNEFLGIEVTENIRLNWNFTHCLYSWFRTTWYHNIFKIGLQFQNVINSFGKCCILEKLILCITKKKQVVVIPFVTSKIFSGKALTALLKNKMLTVSEKQNFLFFRQWLGIRYTGYLNPVYGIGKTKFLIFYDNFDLNTFLQPEMFLLSSFNA